MLIFGITGGSGAGKSSVSDIFRTLGVYVIDADKVARKVVEPGEKCLEILTKRLGTVILNPDGTMNRAKVAEIVFSDSEKLEILNKVTHKYINEAIISELDSEKPQIAAVDGAVIIGSPIEKICRFIVSVTADEEIRINRITERDGMSRESARKRIAAQPSEEFYIENSKYIIKNNGGISELERAAREVVAAIKKEYRFE